MCRKKDIDTLLGAELLMATFKKIITVIPLLIITFLFIDANYAWEYDTMGIAGFLEIIINLLPLYLFVIIDVLKREQLTLIQIFIQSSFYVYIFAVLSLTIYFILFRELSWQVMLDMFYYRINNGVGFNLVPFTIFNYYSIFDRQIIGNLIMLLPLGIYLPLLYNKISGFIKVLLVAILISSSIEIIQLMVSNRGTDIDDVILNSIGAGIGYIIYKAKFYSDGV